MNGWPESPDKLRLSPKAPELVKSFLISGKVVAAICHAPWLLIEAGAAQGRKPTSFGSSKTAVTNAGKQWIDEQVVTDDSNNRGDLDAFCVKIIEEVKEGRYEHRRLVA